MARPNGTERFRPPTEVPGRIGMRIREQESFAEALYGGEIFWELRDGKTGELQDSGRFENVVTKDASILVARLMKSPGTPNVSEPSFGVYALAVGTGDGGWDPLNPPAARSSSPRTRCISASQDSSPDS